MSLISVIIPTLNAGETIDETLACIAPYCSDLVREIIVSDGGSKDDTVARARRAGCTVVEGSHSRGVQLAQGAALSEGAWLLFVHADTHLSENWANQVRAFIKRAETTGRAATFEFALSDLSFMARILERIVAVRVWLFALPYGDQGLLIHRQFYLALGGYRLLPLMEDVDFVRRIGRSRLEVLPVRAFTSAVRYQREGYLKRMARNALCISLYFVGVPPHFIARIYD